jgi:hypothetical protein
MSRDLYGSRSAWDRVPHWVASEGLRHVANEFRPFGAGAVVLATEA